MNGPVMNTEMLVRDAAATLSRYVQFDTTNPPGNELPAALWLRDQLVSRGVTRDVVVHEPVRGRGLVLARIPGAEPLKPLMLNHHIDVVAADPAQWTHPPFSGEVADGFVWGRGTLDTKGLGVFFLLALQRLQREGVKFRRPIVFTAVPDEEPGGEKGMRWLVEHHASEIDPEWVWDEGSGGLKGVFGEKPMFPVVVAEKQVYRVRLTATGEPGHGSMPYPDSAVHKLIRALNRVVGVRRPMRVGTAAAAMFRALADTQGFPASFFLRHLSRRSVLSLAGPKLARDKFTNAVLRDTVSVNVIQAGYQINVIPGRAVAEVDARLLPETNAAEFHRWLERRVAPEGVRIEVVKRLPTSGTAPLDTPFYRAVGRAVSQRMPDAGVFPLLMAGATDGHYWRERGYAAYGFTPVILERQDINRVHGVDERISLDNLLLGIRMTGDIIQALCA
jgi:acetylornithine deacetylase/succinyl-diaminopimelate desuccinylase-like protein